MDKPFDSLCNEITDIILNFLPVEDKKHARLVTHTWCSLIDRKMNFQISFNDETAKFILNSKIVINHLILQNFETPLTFSTSRSKFTKQVKSLMIESLVNKNSTRLLKSCTEIRKLSFSPGALKMNNPSFLECLRFDFLNELLINIRESHLKQSRAFIELGYTLYCPNLKILCLNWGLSMPYNGKLFVNEYMAMFSLISNHYKSLRVLKMKVPQILATIDFSKVHYNMSRVQGIIQNLKQMELTNLSIKYAPIEGFGPFNLGLHLTRSQAKLEKLVVCDRIFVSVEDAIMKSSNTLTTIGLISNNMANFNCQSLENCTNLKILEIFTSMNGELLNVTKIPKSLTIFFHKGPLTTENVIWIIENLNLLNQLTLLNPQGNHYYFSISMLKKLLKKTKVEKICLWCTCDDEDISYYCNTVPGLNLVYVLQDYVVTTKLYSISVDRAIFKKELMQEY